MKHLALALVALLSFAISATVRGADPPRRVGCFFDTTNIKAASKLCDEMRAGLRERGWKDQGELLFLISNEYVEARMADAARTLISQRPEVIVSDGTAAEALKKATTTVPIVAVGFGDIVRAGLGQSSERPGGNITGVSFLLAPSASAKSFALLRRINSRADRIGILFDPNDKGITAEARETWTAAAKSAGMTVHWLAARPEPAEVSKVMSDVRRRVDAVLVVSPLLGRWGDWLADGSVRYGVPLIGTLALSGDSGPLMVLRWKKEPMYRQAASFVDRILRGANPGSLPVERATEFRLILDLRVARALGLTIPQDVLGMASERIQ